jgi:hypothetical protein
MLILAGKFWKGCTPKDEHHWTNRGYVRVQEGQEAWVQILPTLFPRILGWFQRDYLKEASYSSLQGAKNPWGIGWSTAMRKLGLRCSSHPSGA